MLNRLKRYLYISILSSLTILSCVYGASQPETVDLCEIYPSEIKEDIDDILIPDLGKFEERDIYKLSEFTFSYSDDFHITTSVADLGIGHDQCGALWAVIVPRMEGSVRSSLFPENEEILHIWIRFHPDRLKTLFPIGTVFGDGDQNLFNPIQRIANFKAKDSLYKNNALVIPACERLVFDIDTFTDRRQISSDTHSPPSLNTQFSGKSLPPVESQFRQAREFDKSYEEIFEDIWFEFDSRYAMFAIRPDVDWSKLKTDYLPKAVAVESDYEFAKVVAEMLSHLKDGHVWVSLNTISIPVYHHSYFLNANAEAYPLLIGPITKISPSVEWGRTLDDIGFIAIHSWSDQGIPGDVETALFALHNTKAMIIDVRFNSGGGEDLAQLVAGRFTIKDHVYAYSQYRNGPNHDDLTEMLPRAFGPSGDWQYVRPVVVLTGQRCMSSNEAFIKMMGECENVKLMGNRTRGSSGNPAIHTFAKGLSISIPQWIDYRADKVPLEGNGIEPDILFEPGEDSFTGQKDDLLRAALERLRH